MNIRFVFSFEKFLYFFILLILLIRVLSNINIFDNSLAVIFPVAIIPLGLFYLIINSGKIKDNRLNLNSFLFIAICLFLLIIPIFQNLFLDNLVDGFDRYSHNFIWVVSLLGLAWIIAGGIFGSIQDSTVFFKYLNFVFFIIFCYLLIYSLNGGIFIDYQFLTNLRNDDIKIHHLSLTEPLMLVFYMIIAQFYNSKYKWLFILIVLFLMFSLGGRVAFFCYIFSILIYEFLISKKLNYFFKISLISFISIYMLVFLSSDLDDTFALEKLFLSKGLNNDESFQSRMQFFHDFFNGFLSQIIIGNPNFLIYTRNDLGSYAHNILSVFQFYGLIPFILIMFSLFYIIRKFLVLKLFRSSDVFIIFGILFFIYTTLSVIVGKAVLFSSLWFILGFWFFKFKNMQVSKDVLK
ncbi:hypothetical protein [Acinetobacter indicus]|uniref:hypothetical protein n=1 Tax=Acinetobacter indicus TaxID=756892 RepID=UPI000CEB6F8B|nr:hypothetical protein [Acinetobacter indicus]AVH15438.1 hypothetical protein CTZ23_14905 [Acinetobacter indicus]